MRMADPGKVAILTAIAISIFAIPTAGWEADVHYGLTRWLAIQAGFSVDKAEVVAYSAWIPDLESHVNAISASYHSLLGGEITASHTIRQHHFPSKVPPRAPRLKRVVLPGTCKAVELNMRDDPPTLFDLGSAIHALQDSWSHAGVPSRPLWFDEEVTWGHPDDRGGCWSHKADWTSQWVSNKSAGGRNDALEAARSTFKFLVKFLADNPSYAKGPPVKWDEAIEKEVIDFTKARSKALKHVWFQRDEIRRQQGRLGFIETTTLYGPYLPHISLPQRPSELSAGAGTERPILNSQDAARQGLVAQGAAFIPFIQSSIGEPSLQRTATVFLNAWVRGDIGKAMKNASLDHIGADLRSHGIVDFESKGWAERFLMMWLIEEHAALDEAGHGMPTAGNRSMYLVLPTAPRKDGPYKTISFESFDKAISLPRRDGQLEFIRLSSSFPCLVASSFEYVGRLMAQPPSWGRLERKQRPSFEEISTDCRTYGLLLRFNRLPHDQILVAFRKSQKRWQVTGLRWAL